MDKRALLDRLAGSGEERLLYARVLDKLAVGRCPIGQQCFVQAQVDDFSGEQPPAFQRFLRQIHEMYAPFPEENPFSPLYGFLFSVARGKKAA